MLLNNSLQCTQSTEKWCEGILHHSFCVLLSVQNGTLGVVFLVSTSLESENKGPENSMFGQQMRMDGTWLEDLKDVLKGICFRSK